MGPVRLGWDTLLVLVLPPAQKFAERPTAFLLINFFEHLLTLLELVGWVSNYPVIYHRRKLFVEILKSRSTPIWTTPNWTNPNWTKNHYTQPAFKSWSTPI